MDIQGLQIDLGLKENGINRNITEIKRSFRGLNSDLKLTDKIFKNTEDSAKDYAGELNKLGVASKVLQKNLDDLESELDAVDTSTAKGRKKATQLRVEYNKQAMSAQVLANRIDELEDEYEELAFKATLAGKVINNAGKLNSAWGGMNDSINRIGDSFRNLGYVSNTMISGMVVQNISTIVPVAGSAISAIAGIGGALTATSGGAIGLGGAFGIALGGIHAFAGQAKTALQMIEDGEMKATAELNNYQTSLSGLQNQWKGLVQSNQASIFNTMSNGINSAKFALTALTPFITKTTNQIAQFSQRMLEWVQTSKNASGAFTMLNQVGPPIFQNILNSIFKVTDGLVHMGTQFAPLFTWVGAGLESMANKFNTWANSASTDNGISQFIEYTKTNLPIVGQIFGNVFSGIVSLFQAFSGHSHDVLVGMQGVTNTFKEWAQNLSGTEGFKNFIDYLNTNGPKVWQLLKNIGSIAVNVISGLAPVGSVMLTITTAVTGFIAKLTESKIVTTGLIGVATVLIGAMMALGPAILITRSALKAYGFAMSGISAVTKICGAVQTAYRVAVSGVQTATLLAMYATDKFKNSQLLAKAQMMAMKTQMVIAKGATLAWTAVTKGASLATRGLGLAIRFMTGPVGIVITAITALVAGIIYLWKTNSTFRNIVISTWNAIKNSAIAIFGFIKTWIINIWNGIKSASVAIWNGIKSAVMFIVRGWINGIKLYIYVIRTVITTVFNFIKTWSIKIWNGIKNGVMFIVRAWVTGVKLYIYAIRKVITTVFNFIKYWSIRIWNGIKNSITTIIRILYTNARNIFNFLKSAIVKIISTLRGWLITAWNFIKNKVVGTIVALYNRARAIFSTLSRVTRSIFSAVKNFLISLWVNTKNKVISLVQSLWNGVKSRWNSLSKGTRNLFNSVKNFLYSLWQKVRDKVVGFATSLYNGVKSKFNSLKNSVKDIFNKVKNKAVDTWQNLKDSLVGFATTIKDKVTGAFGKMRDILSDIIDKISGFIKKMIGKVEDGLNGLIKGVNKVGSLLGMGKEMIKPVKFSTGTETSSTHTQNVVSNGAINQPTMAMVNDRGPGNSASGGTQELIQRRDGSVEAPRGKNALVGLNKGDSVINGRTTSKMMKQGLIPKFSKGTKKKKDKNLGDYMNDVKGAVGDKAKDTAHGISNGAQKALEESGKAINLSKDWIKDKIGDVMDWVDKPGKLLDKILGGMGIGMKSFGLTKDSVPHKLMGGMFKKLKSGAVDLIKQWFEEAEGGEGDAGWLLKHDIWQKFGNYTGGLGFNGGKHYGVDFGMTPGTNVKAVAGGKVSRVWNDYGGGKSIEVDLGKGLTNWYMHLSKQLVKKGDKVGVGDLIAKSGNTGAFTAGSGHLHFQLNKNGQPQSNVLEWLKGLGGGGKKKPSAWRSTIEKASKKMKAGASKKEIDGIIAQIARESNGDAGVTQGNIGDINNLRGTPAQGLLQYVPSTFKAYAMKGHGNIKSGYDQLLAFFNNSNWRRDLPYGKSGWGPSGSRRFATGGIIKSSGMYNIAEDGHPEIVIPTDPTRANDAMKLIAYAQNKIQGKPKGNKRPNQLPNSNTSVNNTDNTQLLQVLTQQVQKQDKQIELLTQLVASTVNIENQPKGFNEKDVSQAQGDRARMNRFNLGM